MIHFRKESWFFLAGILMLNTGINVLINAGDIREICQFLGGTLVTVGAVTLASVAWDLLVTTRKR